MKSLSQIIIDEIKNEDIVKFHLAIDKLRSAFNLRIRIKENGRANKAMNEFPLFEECDYGQDVEVLENDNFAFAPLDWVLDMWNDLVMDVYDIWKERQIENDPNLPSDYEKCDDYDDYLEENYSYEVFCEESEENKALSYITRRGLL
jgi:hypothetical protein